MPPDGALARWFHEMRVAGEILERPLVMASGMKDAYREVGFVDVQERIFKIPTNGWPKDERLKELGRMWERQFQQGLSGFSFWLFNRAYGRTREETEVCTNTRLVTARLSQMLTVSQQVLLMDVRREFSDTRIHAYIPIHVVWGRKPYLGEGTTPTPSFRA